MGDEIARLEAGGAGDRLAIGDLRAEDRRELLHRGGARAASTSTGTSPAADVCTTEEATRPSRRQRERGPQRRMARERDLRIGREDPNVVPIGTNGGDERGLGEAISRAT